MKTMRPGIVRSCGVLLVLVACSRPATFREPRTGIVFVRIPAGEFEMGSAESDPMRHPDEGLHAVRITRPIYFATTEVTQAQWAAITGSNPSHFRGNSAAPVETITWYDVREFLRRLNANASGKRAFRLPTEAEWEYACRGGSRAPYGTGRRLDTLLANYDGRYPVGHESGSFRGRTLPVASFAPNGFGLHDMSGNVWEWCADEYCPYPSSLAVDPLQQCGSRYKPIRGGSWYFGADAARCATRYTHEPRLRGFSIGFRVVMEER